MLGFEDIDNDGVYRFIDDNSIMLATTWQAGSPAGSGNCGYMDVTSPRDAPQIMTDGPCKGTTHFGICEDIPPAAPTTADPTTAAPTTATPTTAEPTFQPTYSLVLYLMIVSMHNMYKNKEYG